MMSNGMIRSSPLRSPYTLNVMPSCTIDRSAARCRRVRSSGEHAADALEERLAIGARQPVVVEHFVVEAVRRVLGQRNR